VPGMASMPRISKGPDMEHSEKPKAIVLFSGGVDSTTCLAIARSDGFDPHALSFFYHQRHRVELESARKLVALMGVRQHMTLELPLARIGGSALTADIPVPKDNRPEDMGTAIPTTYVPARNTIFLAFALGWAEVLSAADIYIGVNALDYSGYPDCRPEYIDAFTRMANLATRETVEGRIRMRIHTPLMRMSKSEIIRRGVELGVDFGLTHSCYDPDEEGRACGHCDSCILRRKGFEEACIPDPTRYSPWSGM